MRESEYRVVSIDQGSVKASSLRTLDRHLGARAEGGLMASRLGVGCVCTNGHLVPACYPYSTVDGISFLLSFPD